MTARCGTFSWFWMLPSMSWRDLGTLSELPSSSPAHVQFISISHIEPYRVTAQLGSFVTCPLLPACGPDSSLCVQRELRDKAVLSNAALLCAFPRHAGAIVNFCVRACVLYSLLPLSLRSVSAILFPGMFCSFYSRKDSILSVLLP